MGILEELTATQTETAVMGALQTAMEVERPMEEGLVAVLAATRCLTLERA